MTDARTDKPGVPAWPKELTDVPEPDYMRGDPPTDNSLIARVQRAPTEYGPLPYNVNTLLTDVLVEIDRLTLLASDRGTEIERLRAEVRRAYDRGHHDGALGMTEIPVEYREADSASAGCPRCAGKDVLTPIAEDPNRVDPPELL